MISFAFGLKKTKLKENHGKTGRKSCVSHFGLTPRCRCQRTPHQRSTQKPTHPHLPLSRSMARPIITDPSAPEQRRNPRWQLKTAAQLIVNSNQVVQVRTLDISAGGLSVITQFALPMGTVVQINLMLPTWNGPIVPMSVRASVMNCSLDGRNGGFRIGMQFTEIDAGLQQEIERRVNHY